MKWFVVRGFIVGFFRFRRSIKIAPGIKINLNKKSTSLTIGRRGVHTTINGSGVRNTIGLPGSGLSYTSYQKFDSNSVSKGIPYTRVCPNCGHNMRKAWANCPKCSYNLLSLYSKTEADTSESSSQKDVKQSNMDSNTAENPSKGETGCGCLIIIFVVFVIYRLLS